MLDDNATRGTTPRDPDLGNFLDQVEHIREKFNELDIVSEQIKSYSVDLESVTTSKDFGRIHAGFRDQIQQANVIIKTIKSQIDALEVSNRDFQERFQQGRESEMNFRKVSWAGFSNRLRGSLVSFNRAQTNFDTVYTRRTGALGLNTDLTGSPDASPVAGAGKALAVAFDEQDAIRKEDMKRLERSLTEIREAFLQIAAMVESQGEMMDCIEFSTVNAKNYAHQANKQLISARKKQRQKLFWKAICILILLCALAGIIVGIVKAVQNTG